MHEALCHSSHDGEDSFFREVVGFPFEFIECSSGLGIEYPFGQFSRIINPTLLSPTCCSLLANNLMTFL